MSVLDFVNGGFEFVGAFLSWLDVKRIYKDKEVKGVNWYTRAFFSLWGYWNVFYYPSLDQWFSMAGGLALALSNTLWVVLALKYKDTKCH